MNSLEEMGYHVKPITQVFTPFKTWEGSKLQEWEITLQLLTAGDQIIVARQIAEDAPAVLIYTTKIHLLDMSFISFNTCLIFPVYLNSFPA